MSELKPCPFCGSEVYIEEYTNPFAYTSKNGEIFFRDEPDGYKIECKNHAWKVINKDSIAADVLLCSFGLGDDAKNALIEAWNTRHEPTCNWRYDEQMDAWETECGGAFQIMCGTPAENEMTHCPYCGGLIVEVVR